MNLDHRIAEEDSLMGDEAWKGSVLGGRLHKVILAKCRYSLKTPSYLLRILALLVLFLLALTFAGSGHIPSSKLRLAFSSQKASPEMPVIGLVFYGRRDRVSILDCYLQRNLKRNGGLLDEVQFFVHTEDEEDLKWLDDTVEKTPGYRKIVNEESNFGTAYDEVRRGVLYIKIDDDVIFVSDDAVEELIKAKLENPQFVVMSSNVVNHPLISWLHYHMGAVHPYLPELQSPHERTKRPDSWRASELPRWSGPKDYSLPEDFEPPFEGHRWLPLPDSAGQNNNDETPVSMTEYDSFGPGWSKWQTAAQEHYSLLDTLERDPKLKAYEFGVWDTIYDRLSINFIAFMGEDIIDNGPMPTDDELYLTHELPMKTKRHVGICGKGVVAHFSYYTQSVGLLATDILSRYKAYAEENVCGRRR